MRLLFFDSGKVSRQEKESNVSSSNGFGYCSDLSRRVLEYINDIEDLSALSMTNMCLRRCITLRMVVSCAILKGGYPLRSIQNLAPLISRRAIYVPKPLRLLRMVLPGPCEFCGNKPQFVPNIEQVLVPKHVKTNLIPDYFGTRFKFRLPKRDWFGPTENLSSKPRIVRPTFGVKGCFTCMRDRRRVKYNGRWVSFRLNARFDRLMTRYRGRKILHYVNAYYEAHKSTLYQIFCHPRVLAYPGGYRFIEEFAEGRYRTTTNWRNTISSEDRHEIMWNDTIMDDTGNPIGPLFTRKMLPGLVSYLNQPNNRGIDHYIDTKAQDVSTVGEYEEFMRAHDTYIEVGTNKQSQITTRRQNQVFHTSMLKINNAMEALSKIIECMNVKTIFNIRRNRHVRRHNQRHWVMHVMRRMLLCYRECYEPRRHCLQFDTGSMRVDQYLHNHLWRLFRDPKSIDRKLALRYANDIFDTMTTTDLRLTNMENVFRQEFYLSGDIQDDFDLVIFRHLERRPPDTRYSRWTDPSPKRSPH